MREVEGEEGVGAVVGVQEPRVPVGGEELSCPHEGSQLNPYLAIAAE